MTQKSKTSLWFKTVDMTTPEELTPPFNLRVCLSLNESIQLKTRYQEARLLSNDQGISFEMADRIDIPFSEIQQVDLSRKGSSGQPFTSVEIRFRDQVLYT
jgi:hypothetical protein